ncbi:MAG TPA: biotin--[acetyl-CoA-carboxylase] ligase [Gemmataceae bacterium]|nr:biotin--[acetyl-CoA-carboxylase] ligase [Gemmataceae bacterium]
MTPTAEWSLPTRQVGRRVLYYDRLASAMTMAAAIAEPGVAVLAGEQTAGRGQYGRSWCCPPGAGVLLAVVISPPPAARRPAVLTAWAAVAVADCVQRMTGLEPRIKWPNDVLIDGKKICGILIESAASSSLTTIAGIGLNVSQSAADFAAACLPDATSLAASSGRSFETTDAARALLEELDRAYGLLADDLAALEAKWVDRLGLVGHEVAAEMADGSIHRGHVRRLTLDGLELATAEVVIRLAPEGVRTMVQGAGDRSPTQQM